MKRLMISAGQVRSSSQRREQLRTADSPAGCTLVLMASTAQYRYSSRLPIIAALQGCAVQQGALSAHQDTEPEQPRCTRPYHTSESDCLQPMGA